MQNREVQYITGTTNNIFRFAAQ